MTTVRYVVLHLASKVLRGYPRGDAAKKDHLVTMIHKLLCAHFVFLFTVVLSDCIPGAGTTNSTSHSESPQSEPT